MIIFRNKSPYYRTLMVLSASRIVLCVLPLFVLVFALWRRGSEFYEEGIAFALLVIVIVVTYAALSRRYRILLSGHNGERALYKIIRHIRWSGNCAVFTNLPVMYRKSHSEIDMLLIGERGILIIEVKNHSGAITGGEDDDFWVQRKKFREGKSTEKKMLNPLIQLKRQRGIIKGLLQENGMNIWVENVLFFSNPGVKLKLKLSDKNHAFSCKSELVEFVNTMNPNKPLSRRESDRIISLVRRMSEKMS
jgi:hypothetical protein